MNPIPAFVWLSENTMGYLNTMPNCDGVRGFSSYRAYDKGSANCVFKDGFFIVGHLYLFSSQLTNLVLNTGTS